jgi:hypothetical protein
VPTLVGSGGQHWGLDHDALDYQESAAGKLGYYAILAVLPDKFARFLYEFS